MPPEDFPRRVFATIRKWEMLRTGDRIGVAVSGGADSVALLRILHALAPAEHWELVVLHVNHGLRGAESDADAQFVEALAAELSLPYRAAELPLAREGNLEQEARQLRNSWFRSTGLDRTAVGHTRSDQAETVLFRFLRGAGAAGLSGILPVTAEGLVRPLFEVTRDEVRAWLSSLGQPWREDSSNTSLAFDRNRLRHQLLPLLEREWNPQMESTLANIAEWARAEESYWDAIIAGLAATTLETRPDGAVILSCDALGRLPVAAARRLIRHAISRTKGDLHGIDFAHVEQIRSLAAQTAGSGRIQIPGVDTMRSFDWLRFAPPGTYGGDRFFSALVEIPGEIMLPESNSRLMLQVENDDCRYNENVNRFDGDLVSGPLELRTWQPGDQYRPVGRATEVKLKTLFQEEKIPIWERRTWPVLAADGVLVWSRRFGVGAAFAAGPASRRVISVREQSVASAESYSQNQNQEPDVQRL